MSSRYRMEVRRDRDGILRAKKVHVPTRSELEAENRRLRDVLVDALWAADYLAEQQAMPDDGFRERLERAREALAGGGKEADGSDSGTPDVRQRGTAVPAPTASTREREELAGDAE